MRFALMIEPQQGITRAHRVELARRPGAGTIVGRKGPPEAMAMIDLRGSLAAGWAA